MKLRKYIIQILIITIFLPTLYAANCGGEIECYCGDTITSAYILNKDLFCQGDGLTLKASLNCNNHKIVGKNSSFGIIIQGEDNKQISNCQIENFSKGIQITTGSVRRTTGWGVIWSETTYSDNTKIKNNILKNNQYGITLSNTKSDIIFNNTFINNSIGGLHHSSSKSLIYDNKFYKTGIYYSITNNNKYCENGIENQYFKGAIGPQCDCIIPFDNLKINSKVNLCYNTYKLKEPLQLEKGSINCQGSTIYTKKDINAINTNGYENSIIEHCNFKNFSKAININSRTEKSGYSNYYYYSKNIKIYNNTFENNKYGIVSSKAKYTEISENEFKNNEIYPIYLDSKSTSTVWKNLFYTKGPYYSSTSGKIFCKDNISNLYLNEVKGPTCDCYILYDSININSKINVCENEYKLKNGIIISNSAELNCQNSTIIGNNKNTGIYGEKVSKTKINNCNIQNYSYGIYYKEYSTTNQISNSTIINVIHGIVIKNNARIEKINNNIIIAKTYNLYNNINRIINATNNWWGTKNETNIQNKFLKPDTVIYKPYLENGPTLDLSISNEDIEFNKENNQINLNIHKSKLLIIEKLEIEILEVSDYKILNKKIINKKIINITNLNNIVIDWNLNTNNEYHIILDPNNKLYETNKNNNYASKNLFDEKTYYLDINTGIEVGNKEIKKYLFNKLNSNKKVNDKENANIIIEITQKNIEFQNQYLNYNTYSIRKPYEADIQSLNSNNIQHIKIECIGIDGCIAGVKKFILEKNIYLNSNYKFTINQTNENAIAIYDHLVFEENYPYYKTETNVFADIIANILNNNLYQIRDHTIPININNQTINYKLQRIIPKHSINYKNYIDKDSLPIVMGGGLWSDITTWNELGTELANEGYEIYLIELTGGENSECKNCYNYEYEFLTNEVYPTYLNFILNLSEKNKLKYIGHSNGARTALDSLSSNQFNQNKIDTLIAVGVPGAFEELSYFAQLIKDSGDTAIERLNEKNISHITVSRISHELESMTAEIFSPSIHTFDSNNKISTNLFSQYYNWMNSTTDKQPGENLKIDYFTLIYGDDGLGYNNDNDFIVPIVDEYKIFNNINSNNKIINRTHLKHLGMSEKPQVKKIIKETLTKNIFNK